MAPAQSQSQVPPAALSVLLFLERAEVAVREASGLGGLHGDSAVATPAAAAFKTAAVGSAVAPAEAQAAADALGAEEEIWRAKIHAYERTLRDLLQKWEGLDRATAERLESRIEDLTPSLETTLAKRRATLAPPPPPQPQAPLRFTAIDPRMASSLAGGSDGESVVIKGSGQNEPAACVEERSAMRETQGALQQPKATSSGATLRRKPNKPGRTNTSAEARGQLEEEMIGYAEGMRGAADGFLKTLKHDNALLADISHQQDINLGNVESSNMKGRKLMRSGQLSFCCTMIMLAVSVVIFFMMIPFIIFT
eukprot:TRINITY_DN46474_c0_g1_i1.p1 TRINITY_DN46474_c0_g1~~TRINITY_DN46474_c0_g1_i1.p1  ORF type:complete len:309 (-),score=57.98 TRINITY_DN46474_c0_g1_i1:81-1007(-)